VKKYLSTTLDVTVAHKFSILYAKIALLRAQPNYRHT